MGWVNATPQPLYPWKRPGTHSTRGWVGFRADLDRCWKFRPTRIRSSDRPARSESLYRLSYTGSSSSMVVSSNETRSHRKGAVSPPGSTLVSNVKGKSVPLQAWSGPGGSRKLRFPDFAITAQDGGKIVSLTHRPPLPPGNTPGTHFC